MKGLRSAAGTAFAVALAVAGTAPTTVIAGGDPLPSVSALPDASATSATGSRLREIGRVRAVTEFCKAAIAQTDLGILQLLDNDREIGAIENLFQFGDFDSSEISRNRVVAQIQTQLTALRAGAVTGNNEMKTLREQIKNSSDPAQQAALTKFEEALDGALTRQKRLTDHIGTSLAGLTHDDRVDVNTGQALNDVPVATTGPGTKSQGSADALASFDPESPTPSRYAKGVAAELRDRVIPIATDENTAADRIDDAFAGCF